MTAGEQDPRDHLQASIEDAYTLERELGRGGMATVYLATDRKHGRLVALKVLDPDLAASLGPERFRREIRTAAGLQHPHILTVLDSGETPTGQLWFTMPYVEGESLRDRLRRERQLSLDAALTITEQMAAALAYAHQHGVIHRDVKPENILLSKEGSALLADFGIARPIATPTSPADEANAVTPSLTKTGMAVGTPQYMSPEQAAGDRALDGRSDCYSLATVLFEMLAGEPPFTAPTPQAVIAKMLTTAAPSIRVVRRDVPVGVEAAITKALATTPAARFSTASDFSRALEAGRTTGTTEIRRPSPARRIGAVVTAVVLLGAAAYGWYTLAHRGPTMLAVLPFDLQGDTADAFLADGIVDEVRSRIGEVPGVGVIANSSTEEYRRTKKPPEQIGRELGVSYLLVGRVRSERSGTGRRVRVSPELIQVANVRRPTSRWQHAFEADLSDPFKLEGEIAADVAAALRLTLSPAAREKAMTRLTQDSAAYYLYLKAQEISNHAGRFDRDDRRRVITFLHQATARDSAFAQAWAVLASNQAYYYRPGGADTSHAGLDSAKAAADRALALAPNLPIAHAAAAACYSRMGDFGRAEKEILTALRAEPNNPQYLNSLGHEVWDRSPDSALSLFERAFVLDPRSFRNANDLSGAYQERGQYRDALRVAEQGLAAEPFNSDLFLRKFRALMALGDTASLRSACKEALGFQPDSYVFLGLCGDFHLVLGEPLVARGMYMHAFALSPPSQKLDWGLYSIHTYWGAGDYRGAEVSVDSLIVRYGARPDAINTQTLTRLAVGDSAGARGLLRMPHPPLRGSVVTAYNAATNDLYWVLDDSSRRDLAKLPPAAFAGNEKPDSGLADLTDRANRAMALTHDAWERGAMAEMKVYADTARQFAMQLVARQPADGPSHTTLGVALAYLGLRDSALHTVAAGLDLTDPSLLETRVYAQLQIARAYMLFSQPDSAAAALERVVNVHWYFVTHAFLRIDPTWRSLRGTPRFDRLVAER